MANQANFQPTEIWTPHTEDPLFDTVIEDARLNINSRNPDQLIHELKKSVQRSDQGIVYAILKGEKPEDYSDKEALVMFNPFSNSATPNMLVRAEFIREAAKIANVCDDDEKLKPVIMLASPGMFGSKLNLSGDDKRQIRRGDLGPAAKELLGAVAGRKYGKVALLGFSQGADMAIAGARSAYSANLDVTALGVGDPAGVEERTRIMLATDFITSRGQFPKSIRAGGIRAQEEAIGLSPVGYRRSKDFAGFAAGSLLPINWMTILAGTSHSSFERNMQEILDDGTVDRNVDRVVVGYGGISSVTRPESIEPSLARLRRKVAGFDNRLLSIRVEGRDHPWGDQLPLLAKLYLKALI